MRADSRPKSPATPDPGNRPKAKGRQAANRASPEAVARTGSSSSQSRDEQGADWVRVGHLSGAQAMLLMVYLLSAKVLFLFPTIISQRTGSSAWLALILATALGLLGLWGWILWIRATGNQGFVASLRLTLGPVLGDLAALFLIVVFAALTALNIRLFTSGAIVGILPHFPLPALLLISILSSIYAAWLGLEAVGRAAVFFFVPTFLSITVVIAGVAGTFHLSNLMPLWGLGAKNTLVQGLLSAGAFGGVPALAVLKSYVRDLRGLPGRGAWSVIIAGAILVVGVVALAGIFPYPMSQRKVEPLGIMARAVFLGRFLQRLEALFTFTWFFAISVQASFSYLIALLLLSQLCNAGTYRPFIPAMASLTFGIAGIPENTLRAAQILDGLFTTGIGNMTLGLGWGLFIVALARGISRTAKKDTRSGGEAPRATGGSHEGK